MRRLRSLLARLPKLALAGLVLALPAVVLAQATGLAVVQAAPTGDPVLDAVSDLKPVADALFAGDLAGVAAALLGLLVILLRSGGGWLFKVLPGAWTTRISEFLLSDPGGALVVTLTPVLAAWSSALSSGIGITWAITWSALKVGLLAAGGFVVILKKIGPWLLGLIRKPKPPPTFGTSVGILS